MSGRAACVVVVAAAVVAGCPEVVEETKDAGPDGFLVTSRPVPFAVSDGDGEARLFLALDTLALEQPTGEQRIIVTFNTFNTTGFGPDAAPALDAGFRQGETVPLEPGGPVVVSSAVDDELVLRARPDVEGGVFADIVVVGTAREDGEPSDDDDDTPIIRLTVVDDE